MPDPIERIPFLNMAALTEGGLLVLALAISWFAGINPFEHLLWQWDSVLWGLAGTVPLFIGFLLTYRFPIGSLQRIRSLLDDVLAPSLAICRWYDLILLACLAGFCEELLFRGVLLPLCQHAAVGPWLHNEPFLVGLILSSLLFGLVHCATVTYVVAASVVGVYLGSLIYVTESPNLFTPIIVHTVYDYLAFLVITYRHRKTVPSDEDASSTGLTTAAEEDRDDRDDGELAPPNSVE
jgi:membrane protease YdiL (CAAX protease family)